MASRVERNCASTKSYLRSVSEWKISSDWWVTVTIVAVMKPDSQIDRKRVSGLTRAAKTAQWAARRAASLYFFAARTYRIESKRQ